MTNDRPDAATAACKDTRRRSAISYTQGNRKAGRSPRGASRTAPSTERICGRFVGAGEFKGREDTHVNDQIYQHHDMEDTGHWFSQDGTKLNTGRWQQWADILGKPCPTAALGPIEWVWKGQEPPPNETRNHSSATLNIQPLVNELDKADKLGLIEYLPPGQDQNSFVTCINPFGVRIKPNGKARILTDPSITGVNACMTKLPCTLTTPEKFLKTIKATDVLGKRDLTNGFYHATLHTSARKYMGFKHPTTGQIGRWVALPQGTAQSPHFFCELTNFSRDIFNHLFTQHNIKASCDVYVDDYPIRADTHKDMQQAFNIMDTEAALLGLEFNPSKDEGNTTPITRMEVLGLLIDAPLLKLDLPAHKKEAYRTEVMHMLNSHTTFKRKELECMVGKLVWASKVTPWGYLHIQHLFDALYPIQTQNTHHKAKHNTITPGMVSDLRFWKQALALKWHESVGMQESMLARKDIQVDSKNFKIHMYTDASKVFGVGGTLGHDTYSHPWPEDMHHVHIGVLELRACMICLQHWAHELAGTSVLCYMDNVQAVSAINKGGSRIPEIRETLTHIALTGLQFGFTVKSKHVKGELNPADAPSRGTANSTNNHYMFKHFDKCNDPPAIIDCFAAADGYNVHKGCTKWFSTQNPLEENWQELCHTTSWANIPFSALGPTLDLMHEAWKAAPEDTICTALVPYWPDAPWARRHLRAKKPHFKVIASYNRGSRIFQDPINGTSTGPTPFPMMVIRTSH